MELVTIINGVAVASSAAIADGTENQHKNVLELIRTYRADLEEFGGVAFETQPFETAGLEPKQVMDAIKVDGKPLDKAQWSRWASGQEGVLWPKFVALMDHCGNDAPLLWMLHARGYDLNSLRHRETETERRLRLSEEENRALRRVLMGTQS